jgi:hypothetical protein
MILDIRFNNGSPVQIQDVRMTSIYPHKDDTDSPPVLVVHFNAPRYGQQNIPLEDIHCITITND